MAPPAPIRHAAPPPARHGWPAAAAALVLLTAAAAGSWATARLAADEIERRSARDVQAALAAGGFDWADVATDGLLVTLTGTAPDEVQRFRAMTRVGTAVEGGRIRDRMTIAPKAPAAPPAFRVELLRTDEGLSVLGLAPAAVDRAALIARLETLAGPGKVTDLLELADHPAPPGWDSALDFALDAVTQAPRGKLTVLEGRVEVTAITDGPAEKARLEAALTRDRPEGIVLSLDISAPRPVISPFTLHMVKDRDGLRFESCSADSEADRDRIRQAAAEAGAAAPECVLGLGAPSPLWADAAVAAVHALAALPAGSVSLTDTAVTLNAPATVPPPVFQDTAAGLEDALPPVFGLTATLEPAPPALAAEPPVFTAQVTPDGMRLRGPITDERMRTAIESFARARFGTLDSDLQVDDRVPAGWTLRVIGALEAMAELRQGTAEVTPELIRLSGVSGSRTATADAAQRLGARLGSGARYALSIRHDPRLDASSDQPGGAECVSRLNAALQGDGIAFASNRAVVAGDPAPALARLAAAMTDCADILIELGAHTDSQGSESFNRDLSLSRAQAVLALMHDAGIPTANLTARGHGETQPLLANDSETGRQGNRRLEFTLRAPAPLPPQQPAPVVTGVTAPVQAAPPAGASGGDRPIADRLDGPPPDLGAAPAGPPEAAPGAAATLAVRPELFQTPGQPGGQSAPTADEIAAEDGLILRPRMIEATGDRLTTPVPPPLGGIAGQGDGAVFGGPAGEGLPGPDAAEPPGAGNRPPPRPLP